MINDQGRYDSIGRVSKNDRGIEEIVGWRKITGQQVCSSKETLHDFSERRFHDFWIKYAFLLTIRDYIVRVEQQSVSDVEVRDKSNTLCPVIPEQTEAIILNQTPEPRE